MNDLVLQSSDLVKSYQTGDFVLEVLKGVDLQAHSGEFISIQGESGCGKTTFLNLLAGLESPDLGNVKWGDFDIAFEKRNALARRRAEYIGIVFQSYYLIPEVNALQNVFMSHRIAYGGNGGGGIAKAKELLERVGLGDRGNQMPATLSGGEKQRIAIARALLTNPKVILADEPTGNLDERTGDSVMELLQELCRERKTCLVLVTHNHEHAARADRQLILTEGRFEY